jgi:hypothetical protein
MTTKFLNANLQNRNVIDQKIIDTTRVSDSLSSKGDLSSTEQITDDYV